MLSLTVSSRCGQTRCRSRSWCCSCLKCHWLMWFCSQSHHRGKHGRTWGRKDNTPLKARFKRNAHERPRVDLISEVISYFWGYLDRLLCQNLGLSSRAGGLFRRVPLRLSLLRLSRLHGPDPSTSCTAGGRCGHPRCCHGFPPECWGLGATETRKI